MQLLHRYRYSVIGNEIIFYHKQMKYNISDSFSTFFLFHLDLSIGLIQLYLRIEIGINVSYIKKLDRSGH